MIVENFRTFVDCFMNFEVPNDTSSDKLSSADIAGNARKLKTFCIGDLN